MDRAKRVIPVLIPIVSIYQSIHVYNVNTSSVHSYDICYMDGNVKSNSNTCMF